MKSLKFLFIFSLLQSFVFSDPDPNFYIFISFGQSNMEGQGEIEEQDKDVMDRFQVLATADFPSIGRQKLTWYKAIPPLCREYNGIGPSDTFGKQLTEVLPQNIKVGIINIAIGGAAIEMFDLDTVEDYLKNNSSDYIRGIAQKYYENNPIKYLINISKEAQKVGVIKGFLLHQGENNNGQQDWPLKVKKVYEDLLKNLNLSQDKVPLLVGEVVREEYGGQCAIHNKIIANVPSVINNSYVISAEGLPPKEDRLHFTSASYRTFGRRYGVQMLKLLLNRTDIPEPELPKEEKSFKNIINEWIERIFK